LLRALVRVSVFSHAGSPWRLSSSCPLRRTAPEKMNPVSPAENTVLSALTLIFTFPWKLAPNRVLPCFMGDASWPPCAACSCGLSNGVCCVSCESQSGSNHTEWKDDDNYGPQASKVRFFRRSGGSVHSYGGMSSIVMYKSICVIHWWHGGTAGWTVSWR
jgi:hypothetical protein